MSFDLRLTPAHHELVERTHRFAAEVVRPVAGEYDQREEFPWPVLEAAAREGFYNPGRAADAERGDEAGDCGNCAAARRSEAEAFVTRDSG